MRAAGSQTPVDYVVQFGKVGGSSLASEADTGDNRAVLFSVAGAGALDEAGEVDNAAEVFGTLGVVARPLDPEVLSGRDFHAEVICLRTADGLVPIAARDLRLRMGGNAPSKGTIALVGYGGGFHSLDPVDGDPTKGSIHVVYCPYDFDSVGVAQKAHCIVLDPKSGNESISIVHADGQSILMQNDGSVQLQSPDGQTFLKIEDEKLTLQSKQVVFNGTVYIGNPTLGVPLLAGPASPPCPRLFLSPTI